MAFMDLDLIAGLVGKSVSGLGMSKTAAMTLEVATGSVTTFQDAVTYTLASAQNHVFSADATNPTQVFMGLIDNGSITDLWVDTYVDDGLNQQGALPAGYKLILAFAWFSIPANETNLDNTTICRRTWV